MPRKEWTRIEELIARLGRLPEDQRSSELELLTQSGESEEVISYLRLNYALKPNPRVISLGQKVGDKYKLTEKIAAGGMGIVYRARQDLVDREVAVKMIHPALANAKMFARLKEEIATMGRLQHVGIVHIFDADIHHFDPDGKHGAIFYTMELVEGPTMRKWMKEEKPSLEQKLGFFAQVCDAVAYAHKKGVIHRDLKPENILVRPSLVPAVLDFGLSRIMMEVSPLGEKGSSNDSKPPEMEMSGTPAYMSPERWAQSGDDHRGDLYALGVILYELLWGSRPLEFDTCDCFEDMKEAALGWTFQGITKEQREGIDEPVLRIIPRLLAKEPDNRPQSAGEVADVIRSVLEKRQRMRRFKKRAPYLIGIAVLIMLTLSWSVKTSENLKRIERSRNALSQAYSILQDRSADAPTKAMSLIPESRQDRHSESDWRQLAVNAMTAWEIVYEAETISGCKRILKVADDGVRFLGIHESGKLALFENGKIHLLGEAAHDPANIAIHPTRPVVAFAYETGEVHVFSKDKGLEAVLNEVVIEPSTITFSPNGEYLAFATVPKASEYYTEEGPSSEIQVIGTDYWNRKPILFRHVDSLEYLPKINPQLKTITGLAYSPDSSKLASWSSVDSGMVLVWDAMEGKLKEGLFCGGPVLETCWKGMGQDLLCIRQDGMAYVWDQRQWAGYTRKVPLAEGAALHHIASSNVGSVGWLPDGSGYAWQDATASKVDVRQSGILHTIALNEGTTDQSMVWVQSLGGWVVFDGNRVHRWLFEMGSHRTLMTSLTENASFAFVPKTSLVAFGDLQGVQLWDLESATPHTQYHLPLSGPVVAPKGSDELWIFSKWAGPVGFHLDFLSHTNSLDIRQYYKRDKGSAGVMAFFDKDNTLAATMGSLLLVGDKKQSVLAITEEAEDGQAGEVVYEFQTLPIGSDCQTLSFNADGRWLVAGSMLNSWLMLWRKEQGPWEASPFRSRAGIPQFLSHAQNQLVIAESDRIIVHDLEKDGAEKSIPLGLDLITNLAECPVNSMLAVAHSKGVSILSIEEDFAPLFVLSLKLSPADRIRSIQFSPDGASLVALVEEESQTLIHIWDIEDLMDRMVRHGFESIDWQCGQTWEVNQVDEVNFYRTIY
jgi:serine/threonine protein kinase/WD40 repeat protein